MTRRRAGALAVLWATFALACSPPSLSIGVLHESGASTGSSTGASTTRLDPRTTDTEATSSGSTTDQDVTTLLATATEPATTTLATTGPLTPATTGTTAAATTTAETPPTFACGRATCDAVAEYCLRYVPQTLDSPPLESCEPLPAGCGGLPQCACLPAEHPRLRAPCECLAGDGFTVTCLGE